MNEYAQQFPDYDQAVYSVESESIAKVSSMRKRGKCSKQAKAAQMRRYRARKGQALRNKHAVHQARYRARLNMSNSPMRNNPPHQTCIDVNPTLLR